jgi:hypothetical protein
MKGLNQGNQEYESMKMNAGGAFSCDVVTGDGIDEHGVALRPLRRGLEK